MKRDNALIRRQVSLLVSKFKLLLKAPEVQTSRSRTCYSLLIRLHFLSLSSIINAVSAISRATKSLDLFISSWAIDRRLKQTPGNWS